MTKHIVRDAAVGLAGLLAVAAHAADASGATTLYKSVGPDGKTVYSDRPPTAGPPPTALRFEFQPASPLAPATLAYIEQLHQSRPAAPPVSALPTGEIVLFTTTWCGYCRQARAHLARRGVAFREIDTETPAGSLAYAQAGGRTGVPYLVADARRVTGYSASTYDSVLTARAGTGARAERMSPPRN
jgi:glutaredoxin